MTDLENQPTTFWFLLGVATFTAKVVAETGAILVTLRRGTFYRTLMLSFRG